MMDKRKEWSLEDEEEDNEDEEGEEAMEGVEDEEEEEEKEDVDPLDAFMMGVNEEVKQIKHTTQKKAGGTPLAGGKATLITVTRVKARGGGGKVGKKGELMQNDQDAMEYSEEEEGDSELASALLSIAKKNKKKDLPVVDHKSIEYMPFRKNFYVEVPELARMTPAEVSTYRVELENIKVKGKDPLDKSREVYWMGRHRMVSKG